MCVYVYGLGVGGVFWLLFVLVHCEGNPNTNSSWNEWDEIRAKSDTLTHRFLLLLFFFLFVNHSSLASLPCAKIA